MVVYTNPCHWLAISFSKAAPSPRCWNQFRNEMLLHFVQITQISRYTSRRRKVGRHLNHNSSV